MHLYLKNNFPVLISLKQTNISRKMKNINLKIQATHSGIIEYVDHNSIIFRFYTRIMYIHLIKHKTIIVILFFNSSIIKEIDKNQLVIIYNKIIRMIE